jgi:hypothetical protein
MRFRKVDVRRCREKVKEIQLEAGFSLRVKFARERPGSAG